MDHKFPGMNIIVNQTIQRQIRNRKSLAKINVTSRQINVTPQHQKTQKVKQKYNNGNNTNTNQYQRLGPQLFNSPYIENNSEDALLHEAALGKCKFWTFYIFIIIN